ncbi:MAG: M2 family metallopeptidase [Bryobacter sp.]|nr:M2 family metallopeptidase [Bryobacter sp.]
MRFVALPVITCFLFTACQQGPTVAEAEKFVAAAEADLYKLSHQLGQASWVQATYITPDTEALAAAATEKTIQAAARYAKEAARFDKVEAPPELRRKLKLLKNGLTLAAPSDPAKAAELTQITTRMEGTYGRGKYCPKPDQCLDLQQLSRIIGESRNPKELEEAWTGWRTISPPLKKDYARYVELANEGARELGFADTGAMWRSKYDMPADDFAKEVDRLWEQVKPLYLSLHTYVRNKLAAQYGKEVVDPNGPIPAHLLGNMWAQSWDNLYPLLAPPNADPGYDLTKILKARQASAVDMTKMGESMYVSLGFSPLPATFWERSMLTKPRDREVVCHASAWDVDNDDDLRIKMCIEPTSEDFFTIYHELGHNYYQRAYNKLPFLFREGANDGFHEAIGDTIQLSITPGYLKEIGLINSIPDPSKDLGLLMRRALEKVSFLPFGLLIDQWRWKVFSGEIKPEQYNSSWWELREKYQGVKAPVARPADAFDPGAKYHVPGGVPYTRYFLAHILQFQFHRALAIKAGCDLKTTPLHRCSIANNKEAGKAFSDMLALGASKPWQESLTILTGKPELDATAIIDYFAPLKKWLDEQNAGSKVGW